MRSVTRAASLHVFDSAAKVSARRQYSKHPFYSQGRSAYHLDEHTGRTTTFRRGIDHVVYGRSRPPRALRRNNLRSRTVQGVRQLTRQGGSHMSRLGTLTILIACIAAAGIALAALAPRSPAASLDEADRLYAERSYAKALDGYRQAIESGAAGERKAEIEYRIAVCLGRSQKWDEAFAQADAFVKSYPDGVWGARGHYWLGQLFSVAQHCGYRVGDKLYRGQEYPKVETAEKPEHACLCQDDAEKAVAAFEKAKRLYEALEPRLEEEEADLDFDLALLLAKRDLGPLIAVLFALERPKHPGIVI